MLLSLSKHLIVFRGIVTVAIFKQSRSLIYGSLLFPTDPLYI